LLAVLADAARARGAVEYTTDLEAVGLGQGGAFVAAPSTGAAVWYNPAGLAAQRGLRLEVEGGIILSPLRYDLAPAPGADPTPAVENTDTLLPAGLAGASYDFGTADFTAGLFAYVPSSSSYDYDPNGPQRFQGVGGRYVLAFFHGAVAYRAWGQLSIGASFGPTYFHAHQTNVISAAPADADPRDELWSVVVETEVHAAPFLTANLGVSWTPAPGWAIGASVMPPFDIDCSGTIHFTPSPLLAALAHVTGDGVHVHLQFPLIARAGVRFWPLPALAIELAGVYEGWSRFKSIDLEPDVTVSAPSLGVTDMKLPLISLPKGYRDVASARLGAEYVADARLTLRAGAYYESAGSPTSLFDITAPESGKVGLAAGATVHLGAGFDLDAALAHTFFPDVTVSDSALRIRNVLVPENTAAVGDGTYHMSLSFFHLGLRYQR
jgi:long-subunit fatty acid transport protein